MTSLYNAQENHYKKMLDLQEKLRKSEEERIRLEERFNLLVRESRNRHQACINKLRMRYVEFLEEQRTRDERNNKLLGALEKVDKSLTVMTAKTERLNILRKQYEAYLLRTYGNPRASGSLTADSGLDSQNDQEISPSCMLSKAVQTMSLQPNSFPYENEAFARSTYKTPDERLRKSNSLEKATPDVRNLKSSPSSLAPFAYEDVNNAFTANLWKPPIPPMTERLSDVNVKKENQYTDHLDHYLEKIKGLYVRLPEKNERENEHSFEEIDHEQNTSGDLLNMTLSEDGFESSAEEEAKKQRNRIRGAREAYASQLLDRRSAVDEENTSENKLLTPASDLYPQPKSLASSSEDGLKLFSEDDLQQPFENALAKLANLSKSRRAVEKMIIESDRAPFIRKEESREEEKEQDEVNTPADVNPDEQISDQEFKDDGDGIIEDDYDHTVDIDTWMPDDFDQQPEEVAPPDPIRDIRRRKLESIEEVEQTEDEENEVDIDESPILPETNEQRNLQSAGSSSGDAGNFKQLSQEINDEQQGSGSNLNYLEQNQPQQPYPDDPSQQYPYDSSVERSKQGVYGDFKNDQHQQYQEYTPNDQNHSHDQYDTGKEYNADVDEEESRLDGHSNASSADLNDPMSYTQDVRIPEGDVKEQSPDLRKKSSTESSKDVKDTSKDVKRKKDVIKSILDSDSESFIERNLSNTDSDFDFN